MSEMLEKARKYEFIQGQQIKEEERPAFHITPYVGWMNDPNGFSYYKGEYHLFYQYNPYSTHWDSMHWGHAVSEDMIHWEYLPLALAPSEVYDDHLKGGCFSGSAIEHDGKLFLIYTGTCNNGNGFEQAQCIAYSEDGIHFEKYEGNPVITAPEGVPTDLFRDPKVWKHDDTYYVVCGASKNGFAQARLYKSTDMFHWEFVNVLAESRGEWGYMWECPDFFTLEGQEVLSVSPQGLTREEFRFQNIYQSGYFILKDGKPEEKAFREWDHGFDFYAPQTFQDGKGRRILIGWMGMPDADEEYVNPTAESEGWQHCLTVPREVTYKNGMLYQYPVEELNGLRKTGVSVSGSSAEIPVNGPFDLDVQVKGEQGKVSLGENLFLEYQDGDVILTLSEKAGAGRKVRKAHVPSGVIESIRVLADTTAVEIYVNGGEVVFSSRYYPETQEQAVKVEAVECDGKIYMLKNYVME